MLPWLAFAAYLAAGSWVGMRVGRAFIREDPEPDYVLGAIMVLLTGFIRPLTLLAGFVMLKLKGP